MFVYLGGKNIAGDLSDLMKLPKLEYIGLLSTPNVTGNLSALKGNENLLSITLDETKITGDLSDLKGCENLTGIGFERRRHHRRPERPGQFFESDFGDLVFSERHR